MLQAGQAPEGAHQALSPARSGGTRLSGRALRVARTTWLLGVLGITLLLAGAGPVRYAQLQHTFANLSPAQELVLRDLGVSGTLHARLIFALEYVVIASFLAVALVIFRRRSDDWVAMLVTAAMVLYAAWVSPPLDALLTAQPIWRAVSMLVQALGMVSAVAFFYVFPDGRFVPGRVRFLVVPLVLWGLGWLLLPASPFNLSNPFRLSLLSFALLMGWWATGIAAQLYRFIRTATPVQQQQTKWILFGLAVGIVGYLLFGFDRFAFPLLRESRAANVVYDLVGVPLFLVTILVIPATFSFSILRYRLWDIDILINRALVYGALTAILAGLYTASITLSQRLFIALTGERSDAAIVLTTLVVASSFTPARMSLQEIVDRYVKPLPDPEKRLRAFGEQVRSLVEVADVERLTSRVLGEATRAFDATCGAVYLWRDGHFQVVQTAGDWNQLEGMSAWLDSRGVRYGWITLGLRKSGREYSEADRATLADLSSLMANAIQLIEGPEPGDRDRAAGNAVGSPRTESTRT